jgi:hypothetical protein
MNFSLAGWISKLYGSFPSFLKSGAVCPLEGLLEIICIAFFWILVIFWIFVLEAQLMTQLIMMEQ